jgi:hypothetical protein
MLEIKLSRRKGWDPINWFKNVKYLCLSQAITWNCKVKCSGLIVFSELRWEVIVCFVDIVGIDDHHCLNFFYITLLQDP